MVSTMNQNTKEKICDNPKLSQSALSQRAIDLHMKQSTSADQDLAKLTLKLKLASPTDESVKMQMIRKLKSQDSVTSSSLSPKSPTSSEHSKADKAKKEKHRQVRSISQYSFDDAPMLPFSVQRKRSKIKKQNSIKSNISADSGSGKSAGGRTTITTQSSITTPSIATNEVVDDRKALRDMLYQGIWVRHRRTIFSVGSFLRMLKSKNSHNYNTIRSTSENEDESR